jgi:hypothetical protein
MLIVPILYGIMCLLFGAIGKKYSKIWGIIQTVLLVIIVVSIVGFIGTLI